MTKPRRWLLAQCTLVLDEARDVLVLFVDLSIHLVYQFFFDCGHVVSRLHILLGEGILFEVKTKNLGEAHHVAGIEFLALYLGLIRRNQRLIFEHKPNKLVILVEKDD